MIDTDFLFLTSMLRAREAKMLSGEKIERMLDASGFDGAAKLLMDCGYPDMSGMDASQLESVLDSRRESVFYELSLYENARGLVDIFRIKYDYHNVKVLVKSMGTRADVSDMLSGSGRARAPDIEYAFVSGDRHGLPHALKAAIREAVAVLAKTRSPQLSDIAVDAAYFSELLELARGVGDGFVLGYARLLIDCANLRTFTRTRRSKRGCDFLKSALFPDGNADIEKIICLAPSGINAAEVFAERALAPAVSRCQAVISGGAYWNFELDCDNATQRYISQAPPSGFGIAAVLLYLAAVEREITAVRQLLTGRLLGISTAIIKERLRDCHV